MSTAQTPSSSSNLLSPPTPGQAPPASRTSNPPPAEPLASASPARSPYLTSSPSWTRLRTTLQSLHKYAVVFPILQSAIDSVISCTDVMEMALIHPDDYQDLVSELKTLSEFLIRYLQQSKASQISELIERTAMVIEEQAKQINDQRGREIGGDLIEANHDIAGLLKCYRCIQASFWQLQANAMLSSDIIGDPLANSRLEQINPAKLANYDSWLSTETNRRTCTKNTRIAVLLELDSWSCNPNSSNIYWMTGMAGTGKTTVASIFCETLKKRKQLVASFFCTRTTAECRDVGRIIPTIVYQLARYSLAFRSALCRILAGDPDISMGAISMQFESLLRDPILKVKDAIPENLVVVIDGLDECADSNSIRHFLEVLFRRSTNLPLKFFVTSQPETAIWQTMQSQYFGPQSVFISHEIEQSFVQADIVLYLSEELKFMSPPEVQVQKLAELSGGLFIYAATAARYIRAGEGFATAHGRLSTILETNSKSGKRHADINDLYTTILAATLEEGLEDEKDLIRLVLWTTLCACEPVSVETLTTLVAVSASSLVLTALQPLQPVVYVSENGNTATTFHASFSDFMFDHSSQFFCDEAKHNQFLARRCFEVMKEQLRFNICHLESSFIRDKDVKDLDDRIKKYLSPTLLYACRYWSDHLRQTTASQELFAYIDEFLSDRFLFWMEVMNLMHWMKIGTKMLCVSKSWLMVSTPMPSNFAEELTVIEQAHSAPLDLSVHIEESRRFIANFMANPVSESTPHIYISALPFRHQSSSVFENFRKHTRGLVTARGQIIERRDAAPFAIWNTGRAANSIAFSPDGTRLVFGTDEGTVTVKDVIDGSLVAGPLKGHEQWVLSVAFSPDGKRIASGSSDCTILVWNANNGMRLAGPFRGHTDTVKSVTFSPDSARIISGSWDHSVRVWGVQGGIPTLAPFLGHSRAVNSVAVSPDGTRIISGSDDHTIQIWDAHRGTRTISPLIGHSDSVTSVAFSPDGTRIISGSKDCTILIWNAVDGSHVANPLKGHSGLVQSVTFSPDGTHIVSSSDDTTVRVWRAVDGTPVGNPFKGHTKRVWSVAFSPDSICIASSGDNSTIHIWNAFANNSSSLQLGHTSPILSVAFSPDGTRIVSGSADHSICIWSANDGSLVTSPMVGHTGWVRSIALSPDGKHIASGSSDHTIIIWNALDGSRIAGPLQGHTSGVTSVCFSPDGTRIVSGSFDNTLRVWSTRDYALVGNPFKGHTSDVISVAFSPSGAYIASGSSDFTIIIWDALKGTLFAGPLRGHNSRVSSVAFSPDGMRIVSGSFDKTIYVWSAHDGTLIADLFNIHKNSIMSVAYSPDGTQIVSGSDDGTVVVSDANNGAVVAGPFKGHTGYVWSVTFSPDGLSVVSGSDDCTIRVWDVRGITSNIHPPEHDPISTNYWKRFIPAPQITVDKVGWVTNRNSNLLFWVPPEVAQYFPPLHNTLLIRPEGSLGIDYKGLLLGNDWHRCYRT
ncbi:Vegetative incompatibility protein HET-E-1 [Ceratobasidium theobromae]|uniref:Vegetative incompatibility protein HET-E-1 n=1 Tax=Ceratobasidium theobromae TaxID=1582974 RepID=A0A5N5QF36_9AGAM|nr:Vegetative incompatibility protein HET-E-1 [Ceratobasidium theobromae]